MIGIFEIGTIKRLPLETSYVNVVAVVHGLMQRCPAETELVIDGTGIGKPVADMFRWRGVVPWCVTATSGIEQTMDAGRRTANVPKLMLISRIQALLFEGRLKVHAKIDEAAAFLEELRDFRVEYSASGHMTYNAKPGKHDDIVSAAAVAAWRLSDGERGWGPPTRQLAATILGLRGNYDQTVPWVVGIDLGKVNDPTAIVVMRRVAVDARQPSVLRGVTPIKVPDISDPTDNRTEERRRRDDIAAAATPHHPDVRGGDAEFINGPLARRTYAIGSLEWAQQREGNDG